MAEKSKWLLFMLFLVFATWFFQEVIVPSLFPHIYGTPSVWLFTLAWVAIIWVLFSCLIFNIRRTSHYH